MPLLSEVRQSQGAASLSVRVFSAAARPYLGLRYKSPRWVLCALGLLVIGAALLPLKAAVAEDRFGDSLDQDRAFNARRRGDVAPLDTVIAVAHLRGKVLNAQLRGSKYIIKVDDNGHIKTVELDATLGLPGPSRSGGDRGGGGFGGGSFGGGGGGGPGG